MGRFRTFDDLVEAAAGHPPYDYQRQLADHGLPELLKAPTGTGKTLAATLAWLWRRRFHPDKSVRASTPHWLVVVLPMRVLVEQTDEVVTRWLKNLGLTSKVECHVVMGGEGKRASDWRRLPQKDAIFVGTLDMLLSRALNRGYGESRFVWPIDFGLFNNGVQWVFDEVQLMGPALPTSRQLEGLRTKLGTALPSVSMWMSATVDESVLRTVDRPELGRIVELSPRDASGPLAERLTAGKRIEQIDATDEVRRYPERIAEVLLERHRPGTLTIAVLNTVERARLVHAIVEGAGSEAEVVLLHSRFRPADRRAHADAALAPIDPDGAGRVVVSTQVLEAGVDVDARVLFTEAAPWPSVVQRAGRCNRTGKQPEPVLLWSRPPNPMPYDIDDVTAAAEELASLEGQSLTPPELGGREVPVTPIVHPVLRRRDLVGLFDTTPDLSGNDLDVGRFLRAANDLDLHVAWRVVEGKPNEDERSPTRDELCPVPVGELRAYLSTLSKRSASGQPLREVAWRYDHLARGWVRLQEREVRPGMIVVLDAAAGGYETDIGWAPSSKARVEPVTSEEPATLDEACEAMGDDPVSSMGHWIALRQHLEDVEREARVLCEHLAPELSDAALEAVAVAGRLHDIGKAHEVFQASLLATATEHEREQRAAGVPWGKSAGGRLRHGRRHFRHELASALALLNDGGVALEDVFERDLVVYLVAAHHGRVRLGIRSLPGESPHDGAEGGRVALGIFDGEQLPAVDIPGGTVPASVLDLSVMEFGERSDGSPSWSARALVLRDRSDLGVFRLGFLEAMLRLADWRASADEA